MLKILWLCFFCGHNVLAAAAVNIQYAWRLAL